MTTQENKYVHFIDYENVHMHVPMNEIAKGKNQQVILFVGNLQTIPNEWLRIDYNVTTIRVKQTGKDTHKAVATSVVTGVSNAIINGVNNLSNIVLGSSSSTTATRTIYARTVSGTGTDGCPVVTAPTTAPSEPTLPSSDVVSIFSDAYTDLEATWNPGWGQTTASETEIIANNTVRKYTALNFSGIDFSI